MPNRSLFHHNAFDADQVQGLLFQAYTRLPLLKPQENGSRVTTVLRLGAYELRLIEFSSGGLALPLWIELHDTVAGTVVERCECREIEDAMGAAALMLRFAQDSRQLPV